MGVVVVGANATRQSKQHGLAQRERERERESDAIAFVQGGCEIWTGSLYREQTLGRAKSEWARRERLPKPKGNTRGVESVHAYYFNRWYPYVLLGENFACVNVFVLSKRRKNNMSR